MSDGEDDLVEKAMDFVVEASKGATPLQVLGALEYARGELLLMLRQNNGPLIGGTTVDKNGLPDTFGGL